MTAALLAVAFFLAPLGILAAAVSPPLGFALIVAALILCGLAKAATR